MLFDTENLRVNEVAADHVQDIAILMSWFRY